jgi:hypothetical protein
VRHSLASVRLACVRHAASVHPEPGSNSPYGLFVPALVLLSTENRVLPLCLLLSFFDSARLVPDSPFFVSHPSWMSNALLGFRFENTH